MKKVGYFEGTDSTILATLAAEGIDTQPLGNGEDGYGKYIGHITKGDNISLIVGYLHKVVPLAERPPSHQIFSIPVRCIRFRYYFLFQNDSMKMPKRSWEMLQRR